MLEAVFLHEGLQRFGLLERTEVLALQVLDQRDLDHLAVGDLADDDGDLVEGQPDGRLIAPLAGHDLEAPPSRPDDERLEDALLGNRGHQLRQVAHDLPRLVWIGIDLIDRDHAPEGGACGGGRRLHAVRVVARLDGARKSSLRHDRCPSFTTGAGGRQSAAPREVLHTLSPKTLLIRARAAGFGSF